MNERATALVTILLVEDSDDSRQVLKLSLEANGYRVLEAHNGREAVEAARESCPDLIVMDLNMPEMTGSRRPGSYASAGPCQDVPIVAITAFDVYGMREASLEAGCNEYIVKPIDFDALDETVRRFTSAW